MSFKTPWVVVFVALLGCSWRLDWPDHRVKIQLSSPPAGGDVVNFQLGLGSASLKPCRRFAHGSWVGTAYAHGTNSADYTQLDRSFEGGELTVADFRPLEGEYCAIVLSVGPVEDLQGDSIRVSAIVDGREHTWSDSRRLDIEIPLDNPSFGASPRQLVATLNIEPGAWVDPTMVASAEPGLVILSHLQGTSRWEITE